MCWVPLVLYSLEWTEKKLRCLGNVPLGFRWNERAIGGVAAGNKWSATTVGMCCPGEQAAALGWIPVRLEEESTLVVQGMGGYTQKQSASHSS